MASTLPAQNDEAVSPEDYLRRIRSSAVYNVAQVTPLDPAPQTSQTLHQKVSFKREDLQPIHSFKIRGAYQRMANLPSAAYQNGVVAASAGNHAQGVAHAAAVLGTQALIVVPETTPTIKQQAITRLGATLVLHGDTYDEAYTQALQLADEQNRAFIHPFDHPETIVGQATIALEILHQTENPDAVFVPVGGGGLIAGIALVLKSLSPQTRIIGVEADEADAMAQSLRQARRIVLPTVGNFADGCAVKQVGEETFRLAQTFVDEVVTISTDEICAAVKQTFEDCRALPEPAGALALAGLTKWSTGQPKNQNLVAVLSGANLNFDRLQFIAERTKTGSGQEAVLAVHIPETPGSFLRLCQTIGKRNLTEFNYRYSDPQRAVVFAGVSTTGPQDKQNLKNDLSAQGFVYADLTQDETAKLHLRHLVGGRNPDPTPERFFRVDFPERPGALAHFLTQLGDRWNISLFHYRNHGSDRGRALVAFQVPPATNLDFKTFLKNQPFPMQDETSSEPIRLFLSHGATR